MGDCGGNRSVVQSNSVNIPDRSMSERIKKKFATAAVGFYKDTAAKYRKADESEHRSLSYFRDCIANLSAQFPDSRVLDLGCGTGRYFHAVQGATGIVGVDVSPEMLHVAETDPVFRENHSPPQTCLC
jgi:ubiquinone/menaquinone biosynthesis C-methylase UbiE